MKSSFFPETELKFSFFCNLPNEDEDEDKDEDEDEEEDSLHTSLEPFRMITKLILAEFTVWKKVVTDQPTD